MEIIEIKHYSKDVKDALNELLPQLSSSATALSDNSVKEIVESEASHLLMAKENDIYYGSLTLVIFKIPTGIRAWIEDVVVDKDSRGKGVGKLLTEKAIELAEQHGAKTIDLTSRPSREAANALYRKAGFKQRDTNIYRYKSV